MCHDTHVEVRRHPWVLFYHGTLQPNWLTSFPGSFCLHFPFYLEALGYSHVLPRPAFTRVLEMQTQVLTLFQQALYPLSHAPSHIVSFSITMTMEQEWVAKNAEVRKQNFRSIKCMEMSWPIERWSRIFLKLIKLSILLTNLQDQTQF